MLTALPAYNTFVTDPSSLLLILLCILLIMVAVFDWWRGIIPDWANATIASGGLFRATLDIGSTPQEAAIAAAAAIVVFEFIRQGYFYWRGHFGMGLGDVKFLGAAATWTGLQGLPTLVLIASLSGLAFTICCRCTGHALGGETRLAFGPHLAAGLAFVCLFGSIN